MTKTVTTSYGPKPEAMPSGIFNYNYLSQEDGFRKALQAALENEGCEAIFIHNAIAILNTQPPAFGYTIRWQGPQFPMLWQYGFEPIWPEPKANVRADQSVYWTWYIRKDVD